LRFLEFEMDLVKPHNVVKFGLNDTPQMSGSMVNNLDYPSNQFDDDDLLEDTGCKPDNS